MDEQRIIQYKPNFDRIADPVGDHFREVRKMVWMDAGDQFRDLTKMIKMAM